MPRGRIISPDFWTDSKIIGLTPFARLFYIGCWNFALCDNGHLADDALGLKLKILPADAVDASELLSEVMSVGRIVRITLSDQAFLHMPKFALHQSASKDSRWSTRCPACKLSDPLANSPESPPASPKNKVEGRGVEASRGEGEATPPPTYCPKHPTGTALPCGPCRTSRLAFEAWQLAQKNKPTPSVTMPKPSECDHPNGPDENGYCLRCGGKP